MLLPAPGGPRGGEGNPGVKTRDRPDAKGARDGQSKGHDLCRPHTTDPAGSQVAPDPHHLRRHARAVSARGDGLMTSDRSKAYGRVMRTLADIGPAKLQPAEDEIVRE